MASTQQAAAIQDLEQADNYFGDYQDPAAYAAMVTDKIAGIQADALNSKDSSFAKQYMELGRHFDMTHNAAYYKIRNNDVLNFENDKLANVNTAISAQDYNTDVTRRQVEINNWYYQDKLETLFFLQIFFMSMLTMSIVYYFQRTGYITSGFAGLLTFVLLLIVGGVGLYRYAFTNTYRDSRWWYKRRFPKPIYKPEVKCGCHDDPFKPNETKIACPAKTGSGPCVSSFFDKDKPGTAALGSDHMNRIDDQLEAETISYLQSGNINAETNGIDFAQDDVPHCPSSTTPPGSTNVALNNLVLPYM